MEQSRNSHLNNKENWSKYSLKGQRVKDIPMIFGQESGWRKLSRKSTPWSTTSIMSQTYYIGLDSAPRSHKGLLQKEMKKQERVGSITNGRILKKHQNEGYTLVFADESGFSLTPSAVRTWAPIGSTPIIYHPYNWEKLSCISAVTTSGKLYFRLYRGKTIRTSEVVAFLRQLLYRIPGKVLLLWDGRPQHRSKKVKEFIEKHPRLEVKRLPAYSPDLNPDEWVWNYLKTRELANYCASNTPELKKEVHLRMRRMQKRPKLIQSFLRASGLSWDNEAPLPN